MNDHREETERLAGEAALHQHRLQSTLEELERRLSPGHLIDGTLRHLNGSEAASNLRAFGDNLGRSARDHPLPVAMMGLSFAWLALSSSRPAATPGGDPTSGQVGFGYAEEGSAVVVTEERIEAADAAAAALEREDGESDTDLTDRRNRLRARVLRLSDRAAESGEALSHRIDETIARVRQQGRSFGHDARVHGRRASDAATRSFEEQPLLTAAIGVGLGAAIAAAFPGTRFEDARMGPARERLQQSVADVAARTLRDTEARAVAAYRSAREEAVRPGSAEPTTS